MDASCLPTRHRPALACVALLLAAACGQVAAPDGPASDGAAPPDPDRPTSAPNQDTGDTDPTAGPPVPWQDGPAVRWTGSGFEVIAYGSGSCPPTASAIEVVGGGAVVVIEVGWQGDPDTPCTEDYGPSMSFIEAAPGQVTGGVPDTARLRQDGVLSAPVEVTHRGAPAG